MTMLGRNDAPKATREAGQLSGMLNEAHATITSINGVVNELENTYHRLMNPAPQAVDKADQGSPIPATVEGQIHYVNSSLQSLYMRLSEFAEAINRAV